MLRVTSTNNAPVVATAIPDQTATVGTAFNYAFPDTTFTDADSGDTLSYAATKGDGTDLPTWLIFTPATRAFTGTPMTADVGTVAVKVTASDTNGGTVSDEFNIDVAADTTPPTLTSATVSADGSAILLQFSEPVARTSATLPQASDFTVTADGIAEPVGEIVDPGVDNQIVVGVDIHQGQDVVVTYTDPTTGDDTRAIQDTSGNDAATFTTGMSGVAAVTNNSEIAPSAPNAPTGLTATASGTDTINLSWTAPVDNGGSVITGYKIEISIDSGTTWTDQVADTASTTTYEHTGLAAGTTRHYRVSAINIIDTSTTTSDVVNATTNNAPVVAHAIPDQTATVGALFSYAFPDTTFTDADTSDTLIYTATKADGMTLPTWLVFTDSTRTFAGTPAASDVETVSVKVTANDSNGGLVSDEFNIVVRADPVAHCDTTDPNEIWCATVTVGQNSSGTFYGYSFSEYGSVAPALFTYRTATISLFSFVYVNTQFRFDLSRNSGTIPSDGLLGTRNFTLEIGTGTDKKTFAIDNPGTNNKFTFTNHGLSWSVNEVVPVKLLLVPNNAPMVANEIPDQTAAVGGSFFYSIPSNTFSDADSDTLSYEATKDDGTTLPTWLSFNPAADNRTFSGTPAASDVGVVSVKVTASDSNGGSVSDEFDITVEEDTTPPTLTSADVASNGTLISLEFSEPVRRVSTGLPQASAFTVTADDIAVTVSTVNPHQVLSDQFFLAINPVFIRQGQDVVVTYTDPTTGDDTRAIQDRAGNDAASFTTGMSGVPAVTNAITRAAVAPNAPTGLTATASGTDTINLSWTAPVDNGGRVITGYKIEVSTDSGSTWTDQVANTASTTTTYEHTGLAAGTTRHYRVSAINIIGTSTTPSDVVMTTTGADAAVTPTGNLLVSNLGQGQEDTPLLARGSQAFTTGAHTAGYTLTSIVLDCSCEDYTTGTVTLHRDARTGTKVADFAGSPNADEDLVLTPTTATTLSANTTYVILAANDFNISGTNWFTASNVNEDSGSAAGWSIADGAQTYDAATSMVVPVALPYLIRVNGDPITPANNPPVVANAIPDQTATEGAAFSYQFPDTTFNDVDTSDTLIYTATKADGMTPLPMWLVFTDSTRTFAGTPAASDVETVAVKVTANDSNGGLVSDEFNIVVGAAPPPTHCDTTDTNELWCANLTVGTGTSLGETFLGYSTQSSGRWGGLTPTDFTWRTATVRVDALQYAGVDIGFGFNLVGGTIPSDGILGASNFSLEIGTGADKKTFAINNPGTTPGFGFTNPGLSWSVNDTVPVKLLRVPNNAPMVATAIPNQMARAGTAFRYSFPTNTFNDADSDPLSYTATKGDGTDLPTWLTFTPATRTFLGTPADADVGTFAVKVTASDGEGGMVSDDFNIEVVDSSSPLLNCNATDPNELWCATLTVGTGTDSGLPLLAMTRKRQDGAH